MKSPNASRPWRYDKNGQLIPPLPPQPRKARPPLKARAIPDAAKLEAARRSTQSRVAELDTLEARRVLARLVSIDATAPADERKAQLLELMNYLATQRTSLRNRFVELTRYEARSETNERLAGVMLAAAQMIDDYKRARKVAA